MNRIEKRCLMSSTALHGGVIAFLALSSLWIARHPIDPSALPPMEMINTSGVKLTEHEGAGGGTPTAPPPSRRQDRLVEPVPVPAPTTPTPPTTPPRVRSQPVPRHEPQVEPPVTAPPKRTEIKVSPSLVKPQETDDRLKATKNTKDTKDSEVRPPKRVVKVATVAKGPTAAELEAEQKAVAAQKLAEERAAEQAAADQRRRAQEAAEAWRRQVGGIRSSLAGNLSSQTEISTPGVGGGGEAWMGYGTYLKAFYEARWRRPSSLPVPVAYVGVAITVARDGTLVRFEVVERSGIRTLDDSVTEVLRRYQRLDPLPAGTTDADRVFRIKFKLEGTTS
jgi:TonB family protein